jgi:hypothetical protein
VTSLRAVPNYLDRALAAGMLVVQSANWAFVSEFHALAPEIPVGVLGRPCPDELQDFAEWVDQVNPEFRAADADFLTAVHELGMTSLVWTVDDLAQRWSGPSTSAPTASSRTSPTASSTSSRNCPEPVPVFGYSSRGAWARDPER